MVSNSEIVSNFSNPILQRFYETLPERPYFGQGKQISTKKIGDKHIKQFCSKDQAQKYPYIQANHPQVTTKIIFDLDYHGACLRAQEMGISEPSIIVVTPLRGTAHAEYFIDPICQKTASPKSKKLLGDVIEAYKEILCADKVIISQLLLTKNPLWTGWEVITGKEHTLTEMAEYIPSGFTEARGRHDRNWTPAQAMPTWEECLNLFSRNETLFKFGRHYAYQIVNECMAQDELYDHIKILLEEKNRKEITKAFPAALPIREIHYISKSISKWTWEHRRDYKRSQQWNVGIMGFEKIKGLSLPDYRKEKKRRQSAAAYRTNDIQREEKKETQRVIWEARTINPALTQKAAAALLKIPYRTVRRCWI